MSSIFLSLAIAFIVFIIILLMAPSRISSDTERRKRSVLGQVSEDAYRSNVSAGVGDISLLKDLPPGATALSKLPGMQMMIDLLLKSGLWKQRGKFVMWCALIFLILSFVLRKFKLIGIFGAFGITFFLARFYLKRRIRKRNDQFLNLFPDTVDMIVRSVRSGHPLNAAMRMISENMESPVREEFKQVVDEVSYGRTLTDALSRLAARIDEADLNFFVVVLSVQQETGGSLAEVLGNLSNIIRRRRQLRLKIRALTSEGRATSYVLGGLPVAEFLALYIITPTYLEPLFTTLPGNIMLGIAGALIVGAVWIVRIMVNIDI